MTVDASRPWFGSYYHISIEGSTAHRFLFLILPLHTASTTISHILPFEYIQFPPFANLFNESRIPTLVPSRRLIPSPLSLLTMFFKVHTNFYVHVAAVTFLNLLLSEVHALCLPEDATPLLAERGESSFSLIVIGRYLLVLTKSGFFNADRRS